MDFDVGAINMQMKIIYNPIFSRSESLTAYSIHSKVIGTSLIGLRGSISLASQR